MHSIRATTGSLDPGMSIGDKMYLEQIADILSRTRSETLRRVLRAL